MSGSAKMMRLGTQPVGSISGRPLLPRVTSHLM